MPSDNTPPLPKEFDSRVVPIMREAVEMVKLICYARLRPQLDSRHPQMTADERSLLAGAVVNQLFGTPNPETRFVRFAAARAQQIAAELQGIPRHLGELSILITDALRVQYVCDRIEGREAPEPLRQADRLKILVREREAPMPARFLHLVRTIGAADGLLAADPGPSSR